MHGVTPHNSVIEKSRAVKSQSYFKCK